MELIKDNIYHIYNQGNNRQKIFYNRDNYGFFLQKMNDYLLPYCDVLAWCLMPNHFHWMVYVRESELEIPTSRGAITGKTEIDRVTLNRDVSRGAIAGRTEIDRVTRSHPVNGSIIKRNLNDSIAILLRSYTRAINLQQSRSGSLFRQQTKADCITKPIEVSPSYYNLGFGTLIFIPDPDKDYPQICFNYIHQNPAKAALVKNPEDWEFSSLRDLSGLRNGKLICRQRVEEFGLKL
ncbi:MAG: hypothetical protein PHR62_09260 [Paludibacter sp.]|nr:hypothetical protein [Paludibacter sp.]